MDDELSQPSRGVGDGIRITGAQEASSPPAGGVEPQPPTRRARVEPGSAEVGTSWADEDQEPWDDEWAAADGDLDHVGEHDQHAEHAEHVWPEERDISRQFSAPAPSPSSSPVVNPATATLDDAGGDSGVRAGHGPRWRASADDWADADGDDLVHDDATRVGALDPDRADESDLYSFDDPEPAPPTKVATSAPTGPRRGVRRSSAGGANTVPGGPSREGASTGARFATGVTLLGVAIIVLVVLKRPGGVLLATVALPVAVLELFTALRQRGFQPAIIPGALATVVMPFVAFKRGPAGLLVILLLGTLTVLLWYLVGVVRDRPAVNMAVSTLGLLYVGLLGGTSGLVLSHPKGTAIFSAAVVGTIAYDACGYFIGANAGRVPLAPEISPSKTVEGLVGGMIGCVLITGAVFGVVLKQDLWTLKHAIMAGVVIAVMAPLGDLCESMIKRDLGIKDMGSLLPGHGGVLDRIDAMLFVMPAMYFFATKVL